MLPSLADYERLVYSLQDRFSSIRHSALVVIRHGLAFAEVTGTIEFDDDITLTIWEDLNFARNVIQGYSYAVDRGGERLYWYDPHPIRTILPSPAHSLTTNTFLQTSNEIASLHLA